MLFRISHDKEACVTNIAYGAQLYSRESVFVHGEKQW